MKVAGENVIHVLPPMISYLTEHARVVVKCYLKTGKMRDATVLDRCITAEHTEVKRIIHEARAADEAELQLGLDAAALERPWENFSISSLSPIAGGAIHREHPFLTAATSSMLSKRPSVLDMLRTNRALGLPWTDGPGTTQDESQTDALLPVAQPVMHNIGTGSLLRERFVIPNSNCENSDERPKRTRRPVKYSRRGNTNDNGSGDARQQWDHVRIKR